jgi:hypothetical protein
MIPRSLTSPKFAAAKLQIFMDVDILNNRGEKMANNAPHFYVIFSN